MRCCGGDGDIRVFCFVCLATPASHWMLHLSYLKLQLPWVVSQKIEKCTLGRLWRIREWPPPCLSRKFFWCACYCWLHNISVHLPWPCEEGIHRVNFQIVVLVLGSCVPLVRLGSFTRGLGEVDLSAVIKPFQSCFLSSQLGRNFFKDLESIAMCMEIFVRSGDQALRPEYYPWHSVNVHGRRHIIQE